MQVCHLTMDGSGVIAARRGPNAGMRDFVLLVSQHGTIALNFSGPRACGNADRGVVRRHVGHHHRVGADDGMVAHHDRAEQLGTGTDVDMAADDRRSTRIQSAKRDLLKNQAIGAHLGARMNHHTIWVRQYETTTNEAIQRDVSTRHHTPEPVSERSPSPEGIPPSSPLAPTLVIADAAEQAFARVPFAEAQLLALPVGICCADQGRVELLMIHFWNVDQPSMPGGFAGTFSTRSLRRVEGLCIYSHLTRLALI